MTGNVETGGRRVGFDTGGILTGPGQTCYGRWAVDFVECAGAKKTHLWSKPVSQEKGSSWKIRITLQIDSMERRTASAPLGSSVLDFITDLISFSNARPSERN